MEFTVGIHLSNWDAFIEYCSENLIDYGTLGTFSNVMGVIIYNIHPNHLIELGIFIAKFKENGK